MEPVIRLLFVFTFPLWEERFMRKRHFIISGLMLLVVVVLVVTTMFNPGYASHADEEWYTFGKDQHRTRDSLDTASVPPLDFRWKLEGIGWSISQSVVDSNFIYHIAGYPGSKSYTVA